MIFDSAGRLLILKPTYKGGWTIPGGQVEEDGESPWDACRRETFEECGLWVGRSRLACVDFLRPRAERPGGVRFLFDCGALSDEHLGEIELDGSEIESSGCAAQGGPLAAERPVPPARLAAAGPSAASTSRTAGA